MKNPELVAKISLTILAIVLTIVFLAGVVIPNLVEESPDSQAANTVNMISNSS